jgi:hypothetical protein
MGPRRDCRAHAFGAQRRLTAVGRAATSIVCIVHAGIGRIGPERQRVHSSGDADHGAPRTCIGDRTRRIRG